VFEGSTVAYPTRRVTHEDNGDAKMGSYVVQTGTVRVKTDERGCLGYHLRWRVRGYLVVRIIDLQRGC
jgi:hypothetical protein